ncbi:CCA tRNA nucleotidyltransferase [Pelagibacterium lacus]|uniref:CCA tRNA nucleotidyltransferase n=1 Tax=Pelagibacterium lacus TaxID=2282655 RepID=A0A369W646_9HYPH|nr:CCA tRNA nucleotidyltransferase [Pelagibacterium lacus]RDE08732.1 CCA tRNA nucleotidyltransferase [Pelagibacterium lacus]
MRRDAALARLRGAGWLGRARPFLAVLDGELGRTRAVGGIVRDTLLGREPGGADLDLATELLPKQVVARAEAAGLTAHPTGIDHGTVTLVLEGQTAEVTTLRQDVETFGRKARVAFGTDWRRDAARRDFTMNALYANGDGTLFDPLEGLEDCLAGRVRFIGDPDARIAEDRLRVYRYFRFAVTHGEQAFDPPALAACERAAGTLDLVSAERVGAEMLRLLAARHCALTLETMVRIGVLDRGLFDAETLHALCRLEGLAAPAGVGSRLGLMAARGGGLDRMQGLWRLSNAVIAGARDRAEGAALAAREHWAELGYRHGPEALDALLIAAALADREDGWVRAGMERAEPFVGRKFPIGGADLIGIGFAPGPELGAVLARLEAAWLESDCVPDQAALLALARGWKR